VIGELAARWLAVALEEARFVHQELRRGRIRAAWRRLEELLIGILSPYVECEQEFYAWREEMASCP
jgi:hypothetical protein